MATVRKPIALNETFKTTESTPRNLADVLAQALQILNTTISGLNFINCVVVQTLPTTDISTSTIYLVPKSTAQTSNVYDEYINTDGTTAGWEKIGSTEIDLSNYYTKTETDTLLGGKVDAVAGMGLSHNDFTDTEKTKLSNIESGAEVNVQSDWSQADSSADDYIKNKPSNLVSDASYVHTDNNFTNAEKTKLGGIESGAEVNVQSDWNEADNTKDDYIKNKPSSEVKSATDTFTTVNGGLLEECNIELVPNQDLHGYDHPWMGGAGKNKLNAQDVTISGGFIFENVGIALSAGTYTLSFNSTVSGGQYRITVKNSSDSNIALETRSLQQGSNSVTFTISETSAKCSLYSNNTSSTTYSDLQIEEGSTATAYEPYSNICPINGHTEVDLQRDGKNRLSFSFNIRNINGITFTAYSDGTIMVKGGDTATANADCILGTYDNGGVATILNGCPSGGSSTTYMLNATGGYSDTGSGVSLPASYNNQIYIRIRSGYTIPSGGLLFKPMLRLASDTDPTFEPYQGKLYQVQIGSTVYGGTVDLVSGVMTATYKGVDMGSLTWVYSSGVNSMVTTISDAKQPSADDVELDAILPICRVIKASRRGQETGIRAYMFADNTYNLYIRDSGYVDATIFTTFVTGMAMTYELATPLIIQLTPQQLEALVGQNNLSTPLDGQSIDSVEYREVFAFDDVEKVVSLRVPISMLGTDESGRTTASQAYASGDYFYKDGYMCKALTSISAGATLTLNTNYSQGTLADILKAIENS